MLESRLGKRNLLGMATKSKPSVSKSAQRPSTIHSGIPRRKQQPPQQGERAQAVNSGKAMPIFRKRRHENSR